MGPIVVEMAPQTIQFSPPPPPPPTAPSEACLEGHALDNFLRNSDALRVGNYRLGLYNDRASLGDGQNWFGSSKRDGHHFTEMVRPGVPCPYSLEDPTTSFTHEVHLERGDTFKLLSVTSEKRGCHKVVRVSVPNLCVPVTNPVLTTTGGVLGTPQQVVVTPPPTCLEGDKLAAFLEQSTALVRHDFTLDLHADHSALRSFWTLYGTAKRDGYVFIEPTNGGDRCKETRAGTIVFYTHEVVLERGDAFKIVDITNPHPCKLVARVSVPNLCVKPPEPTNGQILIGGYGGPPVATTLESPNVVTITPGPGTIHVDVGQSMPPPPKTITVPTRAGPLNIELATSPSTGHHQSADHDTFFWMDENGVIHHISQGPEQNKKKT